ncbi:MAG: hypothetical protein ACI9R3_005778 [Verrucomicrobiales bacterium]|jgi:hypothetical protein
MKFFCCLLAGLVFLTSPGSGLANDGAFFESKIRPVLVAHCYKCHSFEGGKSKGGLLLDTRDGIRKGGDSGSAVVPGKVDESLLVAAISHAQPDLEMPPKKPKLSAAVIADFKKWIAAGAADPRTESTGKLSDAPTDLESGRQFWAFRKPVRQPGLTRVDHFIEAKLAEQKIEVSPPADSAILLRRLTFDLIGLPPSRLELAEFLQATKRDGMEAALGARVDELLLSERFGERWGRHWLDVARFAESSGKESNFTYPEAWRYRNYVIDAINDDVPFDRFVAEQLAGDLLPADSDAERARLLIATGFLAVGPRSLNEMNAEQTIADVADEQIGATTQAFMASTVACARCHDHKFDPFSMRDYYALAGIFRSSKTFIGTAVGPDNQTGGELIHLPKTLELPVFNKAIKLEDVEKLRAEKADVLAKQEIAQKKAEEARKAGKDPTEFFSLGMAVGNIWKVGRIDGELAKVNAAGEPHVMCMGVTDRDEAIDSPVYERGEIAHPGDAPVPRGFPEVVEVTNSPQIPDDVSGRLQLAKWLTHPGHPLTARVMANRVWKHLFGVGIVRTTDNFGYNGERPSHPELLDYLALQLRSEYDWSVKKLIREIVLSRSYRQSSDYREAAFLQDPENRWVWRVSKRRLDAEEIRDAMLAVTGELDVKRPVGSLIGRIGNQNAALLVFDKRVAADLDGTVTRSVYLPVVRDKLPDVLELFDFAESSLVTGNRETTNVPMQALYFMNSAFVEQRADAFAKRVRTEEDGGSLIEMAFEICLNRTPDAEELEMAEAFTNSVDADKLKRYCQALLSTAEFRYLD